MYFKLDNFSISGGIEPLKSFSSKYLFNIRIIIINYTI